MGVKPSEAEHDWDYLLQPCYSEDAEAVHVAQTDVRAPYEVRSDGLEAAGLRRFLRAIVAVQEEEEVWADWQGQGYWPGTVAEIHTEAGKRTGYFIHWKDGQKGVVEPDKVLTEKPKKKL